MKLVLVRHGQSTWNKENRFTGWTDVPLSDEGIEEAKKAGLLLKDLNIKFDVAYTSYLKRAIDTLNIIKGQMNCENLPTLYTWRLNERHYGALQGLNKEEMSKKYGDEQVKLWRRSYKTRPPLLTKDDKRYPIYDVKYKNVDESLLPLGESLEDTLNRVLPSYVNEISKDLNNGKNVLVVAHGNSIRAILKYIDNISDDDIVSIEIPTGKPIIKEM